MYAFGDSPDQESVQLMDLETSSCIHDEGEMFERTKIHLKASESIISDN